MILMLSGTSDGRQIGLSLAKAGYKLMMTAVSLYGGDRLPEHDNIVSSVGHLTKEDMVTAIEKKGISLLLDATHPYAVEASVNAMAAAQEGGIPYLRYERPNLKTSFEDGVLYFSDYGEAAQWLKDTKGPIFLTIGSRRLEKFTSILPKERLVARVLPTPEVVGMCADQGLRPNQIIAMQGPFSKDINRAMFSMHAAKYLVTKASSTIGGFEEKLTVAQDLEMITLVIARPKLNYPHCFSQCEKGVEMVKKLTGDPLSEKE